jgi:hypothetical protein
MVAIQSAVRHEIKYILPNQAAAPVANWLRARCRPDPDHPEGLISSVYYDSHDLRLLREKINSDFAKTKVRLRWYLDPGSGAIEGPAYLEIKQKLGARRFKYRVATTIPAAALAEADLQDPILVELLNSLRTETSWVPTDLLPFMEIGFHRRRFLEPATGTRISIDTNICARRVNPAMLPLANPTPLAHAVVEAKGSGRQLPGSLSALRAFGCHRESLSKYGRCYQKVTRRASF